MTQAVWNLFFGDRDKILIHEAGLSRNNDSPTLPSGFNYCAGGLGIGVFTQAGPIGDICVAAGGRTLVADHGAGEAGQDRCQGCPPWSLCHVLYGGIRSDTRHVSGNPTSDRWIASITLGSSLNERAATEMKEGEVCPDNEKSG